MRSNSFRSALIFSLILHLALAGALAAGALFQAETRDITLSARPGEAASSVRLRFTSTKRGAQPQSPADPSTKETQESDADSAAAERAGVLAQSVSELQRRIVYPALAREMGLEGRVRLEAIIDSTGRVQSVRVLESSGYEALDRAAREGAASWSFPADPARTQPMRITIPVRFRGTRQ